MFYSFILQIPFFIYHEYYLFFETIFKKYIIINNNSWTINEYFFIKIINLHPNFIMEYQNKFIFNIFDYLIIIYFELYYYYVQIDFIIC